MTLKAIQNPIVRKNPHDNFFNLGFWDEFGFFFSFQIVIFSGLWTAGASKEFPPILLSQLVELAESECVQLVEKKPWALQECETL